MHARTIQVRKRGTITLPVTIREKYHLEEGDPITLVDLGEGVFLSPKRSLLPKLAQEIDRLREEHGVSTEELIAGVAEQRARYGTDVE
ncbi:MAG: AbrB/MazE/SpoVT family DNA-binding domain-containing protein [Deltaproteobacteria bacterium]|jgi:AbrB family looped-hinge helix DNA binding protein|nr:AbrB/MazE/SpoVT family DNA-binding domain-containing protein [Deltaproteobacteria bacterium]